MPTSVQHAEALLGAIETLKRLEDTGQPPTEADTVRLRAFPGAGCVALDLFPDPTTQQYRSAAWLERGLALRALCTEEEYDSLMRSTFSAYYTSPLVMSAAFAILKHLGVPDTARVLEPGSGIGRFLAYAPEGMRFVGVELDRLSARIATMLSPAQDLRQGDLTGCHLPEGTLDAAVGNVPFADVAYEYRGERLSLHEVCLARALDSLKPGGVAVLVMTHSFLDRERSRFRGQVAASKADLLGAIRLPSTAFEAQGTSVVADLVVFQTHRHTPGLGALPEWTRSLPMQIDGVACPVNAYFHSNPAMVLGTWSRTDRLYGGHTSYSVTPPAACPGAPSGDLPTALAQAIASLPASVVPASVIAVETEEAEEDVSDLRPLPEGAASLPEGALYLDTDSTICQRAGEGGVAVIYSGKTLSPRSGVVGQRVAALIRLKEQAREVLRRQSAGALQGEKQAARSLLTMMHALFTAQHGAINKTTVHATKDGSLTRRQPNVARFKDDPDAMLVMALEHYDEEQDTAARAAIFTQDVVGAPETPVTVESAEAALLQSLDQTGTVDVPLMADLVGKPRAEILNELAELVYQDPATGTWETADQYLSGNVRAKLQVAQRAEGLFARNVAALEAVQPPDLLPSDIEGNLGAPWIPPADIEAFVRDLCEARDSWPLVVRYVPSEAVWAVQAGWQFASSVALGSTYGTRRVDGMTLLEQTLNLRVPKVYDTVEGGDRQVLNGAETLAAGEKQQALKEAFRQWLWVSPQRAERLVRTYNDVYNNIRLRAFAGPHLAFPGMSAEWQGKLKPAQKDAVWRILSGGNTLLAHAVGAGKAQPLHANILTPTGYRRMGDIKVGDTVIAGDGTPTRVIGVFPQGSKAIYAVTFSDGSVAECCEEHLWLTQTYAERSAASSGRRLGKQWPCAQPKVRSLAEIRETLVAAHLGAKNHSIPLAGAVECAAQDVPLDPYCLGALLGDGGMTGEGVRFTKTDAEIVNNFLLPENVEARPVEVRNGCTTWSLVMRKKHGFGAAQEPNPLVVALRSLGLMGKGAAEKFVPSCYKWNSTARRLAVLQGILDTDGWVQKGQPWLSTASERLADDVTFLVQSLGGTTNRSIKHPTYPYKGERRQGLPAYVLSIALPPHVAPFRLQRKARLVIPRTKYQPVRYVVRVDYRGMLYAQCIAVAHPSHLYVTDNFIVTHNTAIMVAAGMKLRQTGRIRKPLYVVPNHMLEQFIREALQLYPNARMLLASSEDMSKRKRKLLAARIATAEWDGIITTHSAFERMGMSPAYQARFLRDLIAQYEEVLTSDTLPGEAHADKGVRNIRKRLEKQKTRYEEKLETLLATDKKDDSLTFDELGIDYVFIDECNQYKNLETPSKLENVAGIQTKGSQRAFDMALKLRYLQEQHPGQCVTMASGTPISNTMVEMYTIQRYLDPEGLTSRGLGHFDAWAATFGEVVESMEIAPDGHSMRPRQRFARFINLSELQMQFRSFADVATKEQLGLPVPPVIGGKAQVVAVPMSLTQRRLQETLVERYEAVRNGEVTPWEDNALAITTDGRKLALDPRFLAPQAPSNVQGKIQACIDQVVQIYHATRDSRATQLVFCDMGVKPTDWGFSAYTIFIDGCVKDGIPASEVRAIHEASSDADKYALQAQMREGKVAVLIGSTAKMGTGLNVQHRLIALHHLDAPWKPAEVEQREGRIIRQGNMHQDTGVYLYTYVTEGSFDAYMWQALQTKAGFIGQVMHGSLTTREVKDIDEQTLTYAEVKAIATGNPAMLVLAKTEAECRRLGLLRKHHADAQYRAQQQLGWLPGEITKYEQRLAGLRADLALLAQSTPADPWQLDASVPELAQQTLETGEMVTPPDDPALRITLWAQTLRQISVTQDVPVGTWRGLTITLRLHSMALPQVLVRGQVQYESPLDRRGGLGRALVRAVGHLVAMYPLYERGLVTDIEKLERSLTRYGASLGQPWPHEAYAQQLDTLRRELKTALTDTKPEERPEDFREAALVAADIEALQAAQHVDTHAPGTGAARVLSIAVPITAQIQARLDSRDTTEA